MNEISSKFLKLILNSEEIFFSIIFCMLLYFNKNGNDKNKITVINTIIYAKINLEDFFFFLFLIKINMAYTIKI